nr:chymotrypsin-2-like [Maniola hyperantus]
MISNKLCIVAIVLILKIVVTATTTLNRNHSSVFDDKLKRKNCTRHAFFRSMDAGAGRGAPGGGPRRVFGGAAAQLSEFPAVCALLDRYWSVRCSGTVLTGHWVLTAAHCVTPNIAYVKYNTRRPASMDGNVTAVYLLYRHAEYKVQQKDEGRGPDVTLLHHDVGLVRTRDAMKLASGPGAGAVLDSLRLVNPVSLYGDEVQVLGFGRTERSVLGEELFSVRLRLLGCERGAWLHCVCGAGDEPRGVCSGDSGGPVLHQGSPIGVTSMGPVECAQTNGSPAAGATSVFTTLERYADVIEATIHDTDAALRMRVIAHATRARHRAALCALCAIITCVIGNLQLACITTIIS